MDEPIEGILLRIFLSEQAELKGKPLYECIVQEAHHQGLAGATVFRGIMGFQGTHRIQTSTILRLSENMPIVIEIVDEKSNIDRFIPYLKEHVTDGLVTTEKVTIIISPPKD